METTTHSVQDVAYVSEQDACAKQHKRQDVHKDMGHMLTFHDPCLEKEFMGIMGKSWVKNDVMMFFMAGLTGSVELFNNISKHGVIAPVTLGMSICCFAVLLVMGLRNPDEYQRWRVQGLSWFKPCLNIVFGISVSHISVSHIWQADKLLTFMLRSGARTVLPPMVMKTLGCPLPFKRHILVLALSSSSFFGWTTSLCNACGADDAVRSTVHKVGWMTENLMIRISLLGFPANIKYPPLGEYPCWQVGLFYGVLMEVLVPAFIIYIQEYCQRIAFLKAKANKDQQAAYNKLRVKTITMVAMYSLVCLQILWFMIRAVGDLYTLGQC